MHDVKIDRYTLIQHFIFCVCILLLKRLFHFFFIHGSLYYFSCKYIIVYELPRVYITYISVYYSAIDIEKAIQKI